MCRYFPWPRSRHCRPKGTRHKTRWTLRQTSNFQTPRSSFSLYRRKRRRDLSNWYFSIVLSPLMISTNSISVTSTIKTRTIVPNSHPTVGMPTSLLKKFHLTTPSWKSTQNQLLEVIQYGQTLTKHMIVWHLLSVLSSKPWQQPIKELNSLKYQRDWDSLSPRTGVHLKIVLQLEMIWLLFTPLFERIRLLVGRECLSTGLSLNELTSWVKMKAMCFWSISSNLSRIITIFRFVIGGLSMVWVLHLRVADFRCRYLG